MKDENGETQGYCRLYISSRMFIAAWEEMKRGEGSRLYLLALCQNHAKMMKCHDRTDRDPDIDQHALNPFGHPKSLALPRLNMLSIRSSALHLFTQNLG